jgi:hypothetical protein
LEQKQNDKTTKKIRNECTPFVSQLIGCGMSFEGCARVEGDDEEDDIDDLENEFDEGGNEQDMQIPMSPEVMLQSLLVFCGLCYNIMSQKVGIA